MATDPLNPLTTTTTASSWTTDPTSWSFKLSEPEPEPEQVDFTKYIREEYPDDEVLQAFAEVIDSNPAIWAAMGQLYRINEYAGDGLVDWSAKKTHLLHDVIRTRLTINIIDKEGTTRARAK